VFFDDAFAEGEPESEALGWLLRRDEGLADACSQRLSHSGAIVPDAQIQSAICLNVAPQPYVSSRLDGIASIFQEIYEHVAQGLRITQKHHVVISRPMYGHTFC